MTPDAAPLRPRREHRVPLGLLADTARAAQTHVDIQVSGITNRSAETRPGDLYAAVPGSRVHGARFAAEAVAAGAVAVLTDTEGAVIAGQLGGIDAPLLVTADVRSVLGPVAAKVYADPSRALQILGITATSGKTTTAYLVEAGLRAAGRVSGLIGTVETRIGAQRVAHQAGASFTTPEAPELQALLAVMVEDGVQTLAMEVSSHALALGRVGGISFAVGAFGNLSQDHLDFHRDMEDYFAAKALLFDGRSERHVLNVDDEYGARLATRPAPAGVTTVSPSGADADWRITRLTDRPLRGSAFTVSGPDGEVDVELALPGRFNAANALLALAVLHEAGVPAAVAAPALCGVQVPGRMQRVDRGQDFLAVVDYSHKPAAVAAVLDALRLQTHGRLLCVLGCGGDRDRAKRPLMGATAARQADVLVVTDDNPRSEDPAAIRAAMLAGATAVPAAERAEVLEVGDRGAAIRRAVELAGPGDTVLVAGKGHELGQYVEGRVLPFDDVEQLSRAIESVGGHR